MYCCFPSGTFDVEVLLLDRQAGLREAFSVCDEVDKKVPGEGECEREYGRRGGREAREASPNAGQRAWEGRSGRGEREDSGGSSGPETQFSPHLLGLFIHTLFKTLRGSFCLPQVLLPKSSHSNADLIESLSRLKYRLWGSLDLVRVS